MNKIFYSFAILLGCTLPVSAHIGLPDISQGDTTIPSYFTNNHTGNLVTYDYISGTWDIYDLSLNKVASFSLESDCMPFEIELVVDKNGLAHKLESDEVYLTQTFFNDDADWEYIVPVRGDSRIESCTVKKTDGTVVGSISTDVWRWNVCIINDVVYVYALDSSGEESLYTIQEFRKLISGDASAVNAVPALTISTNSHDLAGKRVPAAHKGIVIENDRKMFVK